MEVVQFTLATSLSKAPRYAAQGEVALDRRFRSGISGRSAILF